MIKFNLLSMMIQVCAGARNLFVQNFNFGKSVRCAGFCVVSAVGSEKTREADQVNELRGVALLSHYLT